MLAHEHPTQNQSQWDSGHRRINRMLRLGYRMHQRGFLRLSLLIDLFNRVVFSADIPSRMYLPDTVTFMHNGLGTVIDERVTFRGPARIFQNVTLGFSHRRAVDGAPTIGANTVLGAGSGVFGPVSVGDNSFIGANVVVSVDVPPGSIVTLPQATVRPK